MSDRAPVLVRMKDGRVRWCMDYHALNSITVKDAFPSPRIEEYLDTLAKLKFMSTLYFAPATFSRAMQALLQGLLWNYVFA